jgi:hypothetical protein
MYGLIHQALRDLAVLHVGEEEWNRMLENAGHTRPACIGMQYYSDTTTVRMIDMVADRLGLSFDEALTAFGSHWIDFAEQTNYARILRMAGDDLTSFIDNLDRMHATIRSNMPQADMPQFEVLQSDDTGMEVRYRSTRQGLAPMVHGILQKLATRFDEHAVISHRPMDDGAIFRIDRVRAA